MRPDDPLILEAGAELERALQTLHWSQIRLAQWAGVAKGSVNRIMRARNTSLRTLTKAAPPGFRWKLTLEAVERR